MLAGKYFSCMVVGLGCRGACERQTAPWTRALHTSCHASLVEGKTLIIPFVGGYQRIPACCFVPNWIVPSRTRLRTAAHRPTSVSKSVVTGRMPVVPWPLYPSIADGNLILFFHCAGLPTEQRP